jgi:hypothetical protein
MHRRAALALPALLAAGRADAAEGDYAFRVRGAATWWARIACASRCAGRSASRYRNC